MPVGSYARFVLRKLGMTSVLSKVVSQEPDVKGIVGKVALGEADAGFVYRTDVRAVAGQVTRDHDPGLGAASVRYEIAVVASRQNKAAARAWISDAARSGGEAGCSRTRAFSAAEQAPLRRALRRDRARARLPVAADRWRSSSRIPLGELLDGMRSEARATRSS